MKQENILIPTYSNEKIKPIEGYEGLYSVTSFGRVWSHNTGRFLKHYKINGNYYISLCNKGKKKCVNIMKLIQEKNFIIDHMSGNKHNNNINNLEWIGNRI